MAEKAKKGEMMTLLSIYTAQWEVKAATKDERQVVAQQGRLARVLWAASEARQPEGQSWPGRPTLRRLLTSLGHAGA
jgi:hypothetical protein